MDTEIQNYINEQWQYLPEEVRMLLADKNLSKKIEAIGKKNGLIDEETRILETETLLAMLCIADPLLYGKELKESLNITEEKLDSVIKEIEISIFAGKKNLLIETFENLEDRPTISTEVSQKLDEKFKNLPKIEQDAIEQSNYQEVLYSIATAQKLSISQMGELEELVTSVMLDLSPREQFESSVVAKLGLLPDKARELTAEINEKILRKIKDAMISRTPANAGKSDTEVLEQAGIKIINKPSLNLIRPQPTAPPAMNDMKPATAQTGSKLAQPFQMSKAKTDHSINATPRITTMSDLKKIAETENKEQPIVPAPSQPAPQKTISDIKPVANKPETVKVYPPKADPYRLSPEE